MNPGGADSDRRYARFFGSDPLRDVEDEMSFHIATREAALRNEGKSPEAARAQAMREFGDYRKIEDELKTIGRRRKRQERRGDMIADVYFDARNAFRSFIRRPLVPTLIVLMLGVSIGAGTAVFSLFETVVLHPLAVRSSAELVVLETHVAGSETRGDLSMPMVRAIAGATHTLSDMAAHLEMSVTIQQSERAEQFNASLVTGNYFNTLGIAASAGRLFTPQDDGPPGSTPYVVISDGMWRRQYGESDVVGKSMHVNGHAFTIVGVAPPRFRGTDLSSPVDVWLPMGMVPTLSNGGLFSYQGALETWSLNTFSPIGRLVPGVTAAQAAVELQSLYARFDAAAPKGSGMSFGPPKKVLLDVASLDERAVARDRVSMIRFLKSLAVAIAICLAIACVNVANLMMMRTAERTREIAMRMVIGARRSRIISQLFMENLTIAIAAGVTGVGVAVLCMRVLARFSLPGGIDISELPLHMNMRVFAFSMATALVCALVFGVMPAVRGSRQTVLSTLQDSRHGAGGRWVRGGSVLVALQVSLCIVLIVMGVMFIRSLRAAMRVDLGYDTEGVSSVAIGLQQSGYKATAALPVLDRIAAVARATKGITQFAMSTAAPISSEPHAWPMNVPGESEKHRIGLNLVGGSYFDALGMRIIAGRPLDDTDTDDTQDVAVVTQNAAEVMWPGENPIGKEIQIMAPIGPVARVVGVVSDGHYTTLSKKAPFVFMPVVQQMGLGAMQKLELIARGRSAADALIGLRRAVHEANPQMASFSETSLSARVGQAQMPQRFGALILTMFGLLSLLISAIGIYAVAAYDVAKRRRELAIRSALGAGRKALVRVVLKQSGAAIAAGCATGLVLAFGGAQAVRSFLFGVRPDEPTSYFLAAVVLGCVATLASWLPARRAASADPMIAIRE